MAGGGATSRLRLEPRATSVPLARKHVRETLAAAGRDDLVEAAELVTSELVTNALVHAGTAIDLTVLVRPDSVRVEIVDGSPHLPTPREYGTTAGTGRGLVMVEELTDGWGVDRRATGRPGKLVWFEIGTSELAHQSVPAEEARLPDSRADVVPVRLLGVPLLLHAAWQQHAEALLREYMLATLDDEAGEQALQVHAEASDALALLAEHLPHPAFGEEPEAMLALVGDPSAATADVTVPVPASSVAHFARLDEAMARAVDAANRRLFLTPPTQPELQAFRRWACAQVLSQSRGEGPVPWTAEELESWVEASLSWDDSEITSAREALVAVADTNTIVAVSGPAVSLLGYDEAAELVGRRLVAIVPMRYRQAHIAGVTLYLYAGRRPMLDRTTRVPVLRKDGTELGVDMTVRAHVLPDERTVFTARLEP
jgi:PAS domain S-box-containing protein